MSTGDEETTPALFEHCQHVYDKMLEESDKKEFDGGTGGEGMVYEGFLTKLITDDLHLSTPYYTHVTGALKRMGCIRQLRRGGSSAESQWLLIKSPSLASFMDQSIRNRKQPKPATEQQFAALQQQMTAINQRLSRVEQALGM